MITAELCGGPLDGQVRAVDDDPLDPGLMLSCDSAAFDFSSRTVIVKSVLYLRERLPLDERARWRYHYSPKGDTRP